MSATALHVVWLRSDVVTSSHAGESWHPIHHASRQAIILGHHIGGYERSSSPHQLSKYVKLVTLVTFEWNSPNRVSH